MLEPFNKLTPAEAERLALLSEECGEVIQAVGKILRHGYESKHPDGGPTNRESLERELGDVRWVIETMKDSGDIDSAHVVLASIHKGEAVAKYLHHNTA